MASTQSRNIPILSSHAFEDASGWYVEAYWIGRPPERLGRFATYSEANDWIMLESAAYFVLRELGRVVQDREHEIQSAKVTSSTGELS
jgi:hypothetical protein